MGTLLCYIKSYLTRSTNPSLQCVYLYRQGTSYKTKPQQLFTYCISVTQNSAALYRNSAHRSHEVNSTNSSAHQARMLKSTSVVLWHWISSRLFALRFTVLSFTSYESHYVTLCSVISLFTYWNCSAIAVGQSDMAFMVTANMATVLQNIVDMATVLQNIADMDTVLQNIVDMTDNCLTEHRRYGHSVTEHHRYGHCLTEHRRYGHCLTGHRKYGHCLRCH